ncbi:MAG: RNA-directed DNA polymerase [Saprospirales bacterium]|nr:RNA-directed DNA polymerase [Saprospirales bacterium]
MKRQGYLIESIAEMDNLYLAYYKARKGKDAKTEVIAYGKKLQENLKRLQAQILAREVETGGYHYFKVFDPKERQICARLSLKGFASCGDECLSSVFEKALIFDTYATAWAKEPMRHWTVRSLSSNAIPWYLKLDVRKFFEKLTTASCAGSFAACSKTAACCAFRPDHRQLLRGSSPGCAIGNLTSQYFANHYLSPVDQFVKRVLHIPAYVRYMDDMVLWHNDKVALLKAGHQLEEYLQERLNLELKPFCPE